MIRKAMKPCSFKGTEQFTGCSFQSKGDMDEKGYFPLMVPQTVPEVKKHKQKAY